MPDPCGEIAILIDDQGDPYLRVRSEFGALWVTADEIADLYGMSAANVVRIVRRVLSDGEVSPAGLAASASPGGRTLHNLEMVLAIGYRVRSPRAVQFRQWARKQMTEFLIKGFALDDRRLKDDVDDDISALAAVQRPSSHRSERR